MRLNLLVQGQWGRDANTSKEMALSLTPESYLKRSDAGRCTDSRRKQKIKTYSMSLDIVYHPNESIESLRISFTFCFPCLIFFLDQDKINLPKKRRKKQSFPWWVVFFFLEKHKKLQMTVLFFCIYWFIFYSFFPIFFWKISIYSLCCNALPVIKKKCNHYFLQTY